MTAQQSAQAWRHKLYKNRPAETDATEDGEEQEDTQHTEQMTGQEEEEKPIDFSTRKRQRLDSASGRRQADSTSGGQDNLLRSFLNQNNALHLPIQRGSAFDPVVPRPADMNPLQLPFLANLLKSAQRPIVEPPDVKPLSAQKNVRPFKLYNPGDPSSALQVTGGVTTPSLLSALAPPETLPGLLTHPALPVSDHEDDKRTCVDSLLRMCSAGTEVSSTCPLPREHAGRKRSNSNSPTSTTDHHLAQKLAGAGSQTSPASSSGIASSSGASPNETVSSGTSGSSHSGETAGRVDSESRRRGRSLPDELKDATYWERRRKNNVAAKRSRDSRRCKEDEIAMRAALLEQENMLLRRQVTTLQFEMEQLRSLLK